MKNIKDYILESSFTNPFKDCKTLEDFFLVYFNIQYLSDFTEELFDETDAAYLFNRENMGYQEFMDWITEMKDEQLTNLKVTYKTVSFDVKGEYFDLDYVGE